jgi:hypothetical protein
VGEAISATAKEQQNPTTGEQQAKYSILDTCGGHQGHWTLLSQQFDSERRRRS